MRPDQFCGVRIHSMPAWWLSAMLTNRRLCRVVSRPARSRKHSSRPTSASPDVVVMPVGQELHVVEPDRVRALDTQFQHEPVGQVDQVLVEHRATTQDRGLTVEAAVGVGARVVDGPRVLPLGRPPGAEIAVAGRGQRLTQALGRGVEPVVGECDVLHGIPSERHPARSTPERVRNCSTAVVQPRTRSAAMARPGHLRICGAADADSQTASAQRPRRVLVGDVVTGYGGATSGCPHRPSGSDSPGSAATCLDPPGLPWHARSP